MARPSTTFESAERHCARGCDADREREQLGGVDETNAARAAPADCPKKDEDSAGDEVPPECGIGETAGAVRHQQHHGSIREEE